MEEDYWKHLHQSNAVFLWKAPVKLLFHMPLDMDLENVRSSFCGVLKRAAVLQDGLNKFQKCLGFPIL